MEQLPPFQYNLDAPPSLLPTRDEINCIIQFELLQLHILDFGETASFPPRPSSGFAAISYSHLLMVVTTEIKLTTFTPSSLCFPKLNEDFG